MHRVILGIFALMLGLLAVAASGIGLFRAEDMVELAAKSGADPVVWSSHWRTSLLAYLAVGLLVLAGGGLILRGIASGTLLVGGSVLFAAMIPWISRAIGYSQFDFEKANIVETVLLISLAGFMWAMYINRSRWAGESR